MDPEDAAARTMAEAAVKAPRDVRLRLELGAVQLRIARFDSALRSYQVALQLLGDPTGITASQDAAPPLATSPLLGIALTSQSDAAGESAASLIAAAAAEVNALSDEELANGTAETAGSTAAARVSGTRSSGELRSGVSSAGGQVRSELQGQALLGLGRALDGLGRGREAETHFLQAALLTRGRGDRAMAGASLGLARLRQGRVEEALEAL